MYNMLTNDDLYQEIFKLRLEVEELRKLVKEIIDKQSSSITVPIPVSPSIPYYPPIWYPNVIITTTSNTTP